MANAAFSIHLSSEFYQVNPTNFDKIRALYRSILHREPDPGGLNYWINRLNSGTSWSTVVYNFAFSQEALGRYYRISVQDCSANRLVPSNQRFANATASLSKERSLQFAVAIKPNLGVHVVEGWIRSTSSAPRQLVMPINILQKAETDPDSNRGSNRNFDPADTRFYVILDHVQGWGYIIVNPTTLRLNNRFGGDLTWTTRAYGIGNSYGGNEPNWVWQDLPNASALSSNVRFSRLRLHVTAALLPATSSLPGPLQGLTDAIVSSPDFQMFIRESDRNVTWQGDSFPNIAVHQYGLCNTSSSTVVDNRHPDSTHAWLNMIDFGGWWWNQPQARRINSCSYCSR